MWTSRRLLLINLGAVVTGCGFQLRQSPNYAFSTLFVNLPENDAMGASLRRNIASSGQVTVITDVRDVEKAQVIYEPTLNVREKVILGRTSTGAIREYQLRLRYRFRLRTQGGKELISDTDAEIFLTRDINFNETGALSKESEEALLYRDMENDLIQQVLRRLAAVRSL
jgi:LPS-assembly lipoprotein